MDRLVGYVVDFLAAVGLFALMLGIIAMALGYI